MDSTMMDENARDEALKEFKHLQSQLGVSGRWQTPKYQSEY